MGAPLDLRRYRTNVHLDVEVDAFAEEGWEGLSLVVGEVTFALLHPCERCVIPARDPSTQVKHPSSCATSTARTAAASGSTRAPWTSAASPSEIPHTS